MMTKRSRSILMRVFLFLLLGAIVNVAIAWGCSWWVLPRYAKAEPMRAGDFWPGAKLSANLTGDSQPIARYEGFGITERAAFVVERYRRPKEGNTGQTVLEHRFRAIRWTPEVECQQLDDLYATNNPLNLATDGIGLREQLLEIRTVANAPNNLRVDAGWPLRSVCGWGPGSSQTRKSLMGPAVSVPMVGDFAVVVHHDSRDPIRLLPYCPIWPGFAIDTLFCASILWLLVAAPFALRRWWRFNQELCPRCAYPIGTSDVCTECGQPLRAKTS